MPNYSTTITVNGVKHKTLKDILPKTNKPLKILFIAKTPALKSVEIGHYFQGQQGQFFWNQLREYGILNFKPNTFEDENLLDNNCGFTDIVKVPRNFGNEPTAEEYKAGLDKILKTIEDYQPKVIVFVYKKVLDNILNYGFETKDKSVYGVNTDLKSKFKSQVFVFPMSGTPCTREQRLQAMEDLKAIVNGTFRQTKNLATKKIVKEKVLSRKNNDPNSDLKRKTRSKNNSEFDYETTELNNTNQHFQGQNNEGCSGCRFWVIVIILALLFVLYANIKYGNSY